MNDFERRQLLHELEALQSLAENNGLIRAGAWLQMMRETQAANRKGPFLAG